MANERTRTTAAYKLCSLKTKFTNQFLEAICTTTSAVLSPLGVVIAFLEGDVLRPLRGRGQTEAFRPGTGFTAFLVRCYTQVTEAAQLLFLSGGNQSLHGRAGRLGGEGATRRRSRDVTRMVNGVTSRRGHNRGGQTDT